MYMKKSKLSIILISSLLFLIWSFVNFFSLWQNINIQKETTVKIIKNIAYSNFKKDQAFRFWAASHGGVYVPVTERTPPNPNLAHIPYRDIEKPDGTKLTLMNPAYTIRQIMDEFPGLYGAKSKITSLRYIYEGNKPDEWESQALKSFEDGNKESYEYTEKD